VCRPGGLRLAGDTVFAGYFGAVLLHHVGGVVRGRLAVCRRLFAHVGGHERGGGESALVHEGRAGDGSGDRLTGADNHVGHLDGEALRLAGGCSLEDRGEQRVAFRILADLEGSDDAGRRLGGGEEARARLRRGMVFVGVEHAHVGGDREDAGVDAEAAEIGVSHLSEGEQQPGDHPLRERRCEGAGLDLYGCHVG
jgi:hypothetical protein